MIWLVLAYVALTVLTGSSDLSKTLESLLSLFTTSSS